MSGDERVRHCGDCKKNVYNLSEMTREEAETLILAKEGRLCVRYYQRKDGTILLKDCVIGVAQKRKRRLIAAGAAALLAGGGAAGYAMTRPGPTPERLAVDVATGEESVGLRVQGGTAESPAPPAPPAPPELIEHDEIKGKLEVKMGDYAIDDTDLDTK